MVLLNTKVALLLIMAFDNVMIKTTGRHTPVTSNRAIETLLATAAANGMMIHQMDIIDTAFLNATLDEKIYTCFALKVLI